jgi:hypothetical protein
VGGNRKKEEKYILAPNYIYISDIHPSRDNHLQQALWPVDVERGLMAAGFALNFSDKEEFRSLFFTCSLGPAHVDFPPQI